MPPGAGLSTCGACTVLLNGKPVYEKEPSVSHMVWAANGYWYVGKRDELGKLGFKDSDALIGVRWELSAWIVGVDGRLAGCSTRIQVGHLRDEQRGEVVDITGCEVGHFFGVSLKVESRNLGHSGYFA